MKRILGMIYGVGLDGLLHCIVCAVLTALLCLVLPWWASAATVLAVGIAKEIVWDLLLGRGFAEWKDLLCDVAGIIIGIV